MRVGDLYSTRRDLLKLGGLGLIGASVDGVWPLQMKAGEKKVQPRGTARNVLFYEISGAISHIESFDFKENKGTPKDLDVRKLRDDLYLSHLLFPKLEKHMDKFAMTRSMLSHEEVHFRGQYYQQTGRQLNLAFAREIPAIGSVVAMELEPRAPGQRHVPDIHVVLSGKGRGRRIVHRIPASAILSRRHQPRGRRKGRLNGSESGRADGTALEPALPDFAMPRTARMKAYGKEMAGYGDFYEAAHRLLTDTRWPGAFNITKEDKARYGNNPVAVSRILARNMLAADAGTHYIHMCHPGWDHHVQIWDRTAASNHYTLCSEFDPALSSLMEDLSTMKSKSDPSKTLLDETLVVVMSEFGRTPGALNNMAGRDHYNNCYPALFAGAGVKPGRILGRTDSEGAKCARHRLEPQGAATHGECAGHHVLGAGHRLEQGDSQYAFRAHIPLRRFAGAQRLHSHG